jgi:hypothetical protein
VIDVIDEIAHSVESSGMSDIPIAHRPAVRNLSGVNLDGIHFAMDTTEGGDPGRGQTFEWSIGDLERGADYANS